FQLAHEWLARSWLSGSARRGHTPSATRTSRRQGRKGRINATRVGEAIGRGRWGVPKVVGSNRGCWEQPGVLGATGVVGVAPRLPPGIVLRIPRNIMMPALLAGFVGVVQGARHALEPDHVTAVATVMLRAPSARRGIFYAACWGLGHASMLL